MPTNLGNPWKVSELECIPMNALAVQPLHEVFTIGNGKIPSGVGEDDPIPLLQGLRVHLFGNFFISTSIADFEMS